MKKKYMKPNMNVVDIKPRTLLSGSITEKDGSLKVKFTDDSFDDDETIY